MTPTIRPKPQFIQQAKAETKVTIAIAEIGVLGIEAKREINALIDGEAASVAPHTKTKAICIAKANKDQTPSPQCSTTSNGDCLHIGMATTKAIKLSIIAKIKGSGKYF